MKRTILESIRVYRSPLDHRRGLLVAGGIRIVCALGKAGFVRAKCEGDHGTPIGCFTFRNGFYRADRIVRPRTALSLQPARPCDGWCDDVRDRRYNRLLRLPDAARHETLQREDHLYDVVVDFGFNRKPRIMGRGSAVFLHLARPGFLPTEGCIAVHPSAIRRLIAIIGPKTRLRIGPVTPRIAPSGSE